MNLSELYKNNQKLNDLRQKLHDAYKSNDENAVTDTFLQMFQTVSTIRPWRRPCVPTTPSRRWRT